MNRMSRLRQAKQDLSSRRLVHTASMNRSSSEPPECVTSSPDLSLACPDSPREEPQPNLPVVAVARVLTPQGTPRPQSQSQLSASSALQSTPRTNAQPRPS